MWCLNHKALPTNKLVFMDLVIIASDKVTALLAFWLGELGNECVE